MDKEIEKAKKYLNRSDVKEIDTYDIAYTKAVIIKFNDESYVMISGEDYMEHIKSEVTND